MNSVNIQDITRNIDSTARVFRVESSSTAAISNSTFTDINFSVISVTDSTIQLYDSEMKNISASQNIIECYTSSGIIFRNLTMRDSQTRDRPSMISFRSWTIESISNSKFLDSQLLVFTLRSSQLKEFNSNVLNAMNRGIQLLANSNATIINSIFTNMKQFIRDGKLYQSNIDSLGSAIGKILFL